MKVLERRQSHPYPTPCSRDGAVDIQELFGRYTLDAATDSLMGGSLVGRCRMNIWFRIESELIQMQSTLADLDPIVAGSSGSKSDSTLFLGANSIPGTLYMTN